MKCMNENELNGIWSSIFNTIQNVYKGYTDDRTMAMKNKHLQKLIDEDMKRKESEGPDLKKYLPIVGAGAAILIIMNMRKK